MNPKSIPNRFKVIFIDSVYNYGGRGSILGPTLMSKSLKNVIEKPTENQCPKLTKIWANRDQKSTKITTKTVGKLILCKTCWHLKNLCFSAVKTWFSSIYWYQKTAQIHRELEWNRCLKLDAKMIVTSPKMGPKMAPKINIEHKILSLDRNCLEWC